MEGLITLLCILFTKFAVPCEDRSSAIKAVINPQGSLDLVWREKTGQDYLLKYCTWTGTGFSSPLNVTDSPSYYTAPAAVYTNDDVIHVAYAALNNEYWDIFESSYTYQAPQVPTLSLFWFSMLAILISVLLLKRGTA